MLQYSMNPLTHIRMTGVLFFVKKKELGRKPGEKIGRELPCIRIFLSDKDGWGVLRGTYASLRMCTICCNT
jgi:hypothetical protein